jgi:uncharacterized damage-inducible protein DinB
MVRDVLLETYAANGAMNQWLISQIDPAAWRAEPPGSGDGESRTIAAVFAHLHNNRLVWIRRSAPHLECPEPLDAMTCTQEEAAVAHGSSSACCHEMIRDALSEDPDRKVRRFSRGSWAPDWPAGPSMFAYMFAHEAHHRGQVILLAHQLGFRLPDDSANRIWQWDRLWNELGFAEGPR